ncbi:NAD(P)/FAD-dependent oxidoreductase [Macrococcus equipercicus]|uniref:Ferredoxin--NADP reductase n=1 Tax=Macrococcus equipercicus TaxID=69967 RepID=A0A9Q9F239_9STAP|nr:NAD(P)/FAD-dependent oxidoreductase [Macrococcus equipercicus]KAA1039645.1 NAD(P)/FAD-dependent oxidoreductase [Macrococcus equipercicus]UTH13976.1 NAD(P)/FAD-dependent oxidoreductase [Macrococcus equipercicus]
MSDILDVTVIGGGPAGLYAAFYSGLRGMTVRIIEHHDKLGGKVNLYPEKFIWDIGGVAPKPAAMIVSEMISQGLTFNPEVNVNEKVVNIIKHSDQHFEVVTETTSFYSKAVIIAVGSGIISPMKLAIEGCERYEVNNLHYVVPSLKRFENKRVLISGGGNAAVDWAYEIAALARSVHILCRQDDFKGHEEMVRKLDERGVFKVMSHSISSLQATGDHIDAVIIEHCRTREKSELLVDDVIINHGFHMECDMLDNCDIKLERQDSFYIKGNADSSTNVEGVYAVGDILSHASKVQLIAGCFHDAANAANLAKKYINPEAAQAGTVSSHNDVFKEKNEALVQQLK